MSAVLCGALAHGNYFSRPGFFFLLIVEAEWAGESPALSHLAIGKNSEVLEPTLCGLAPLKTSLAQFSRPWEQIQRGPFPPSPWRAQSCWVSLCSFQEELAPLGRNQPNFRKLGAGKAVSS